MLIVRAPVRLSLAGGGTDLPAYFMRHGGAVVSTTIDKYFYVFLNTNTDRTVQITSSDYQTFYRRDSDTQAFLGKDLNLPRAILDHFGLTHGVSLFLASEIPPGTGLGSSSAVAVAIIKAIATARGLKLSKQQLAELACQIEIEDLRASIGKQDQYAAAFGDLNFYEFATQGVKVNPVCISPETRHELNENLLLFFTGTRREASSILSEQKKSTEQNDASVLDALHAVKEGAFQMKTCLEKGDLKQIGRLLDANWQNKKKFSGRVSNDLIDECYDLARRNGAIGGKITGAGGGGFLMLYCELPCQEAVTRILQAKGLRRMDFHFESEGARVLVNAGQKIANA